MSDRNIGDSANRNVVKNPLLSTAVTGLSIEDLTHNAVLLPAVRSQGANIGLDQQIGTQSRALEHSNNAISNLPSGDGNSNFTPIHFITDHNQNPLTAQQNVENIKTGEQLCFTQSKASVKTEDDFDVNEYFARLQGTRYVSAPVNSLLKEDQNANLEATEENLEEINLNEPDKLQQDDVQQSLTADIAQNFSQLPTVLPQVASAVFSSFSNMLSLKSREQTPDEPKENSGYQEVQFQRPDDTSMNSEGFGVREVAPPPKEPHIGTGNYRITTKKKTYAQIPGLSYGDSVQKTYQPPPLSQSSDMMPYFVPTSNYLPPSNLPQVEKSQEIPLQIDAATSTVSANMNIGQTHPPHASQTVTQTQKDSSYYIFNPVSSNDHFNQLYSQGIPNQTTAIDDGVNISVETITMENQSKFIVPKDQSSNIPTSSQNINSSQGMPPPMISMSQGSIIPPPPMFSNIPRRDSQSGVGKSLLPPSVARRISSNHPIIKNQPAPVASFTDNIFVPSPVESIQNISNIVDNNSSQRTISQELTQSISNITQNISTFAPISSSLSHQPLPTSNLPSISSLVSIAASAISTSSSNVSAVVTNTVLPSNFAPNSISAVITRTSTPPLLNTFQAQAPANDQPKFPPISAALPASSLLAQSNLPPPPKSLSTQAPPESIQAIPKLTPIMQTSTSLIPPLSLQATETEQIPSLFTPTSATETNTLEPTNLPPPPTFFNPNTLREQKDTEIKDITISEQNVLQSNLTQYFDPNITQTEPVKPLVEPPKVSGNLNYRMIKKRPQYYSGPIEGVGAISNNVKPFIPSVETNTFQGAMFTPNQEIQPISVSTISNAAFGINRSLDNVSTPFDLNKPMEHIYSQPNYDTAFDLSRQTSENSETVTQESKGFGIIGSLKSKLSSLDINKIQNTVTTFFDPAYNDIKNEPNDRGSVPCLQQYQSSTSFQQKPQDQSSTFELFAPHVESNTYNQFYDPYSYRNTSYEQNQTFSQPHNQYDYYQNQGQNIHQASDYYSSAPYIPQPAYNDTPINTNISESYTVSLTNFAQENANLFKNTTLPIVENIQISSDASKDNLNTLTAEQEIQKEIVSQNVIELSTKKFFENQFSTDSLLPKFNELDQKLSNLHVIENTLDLQTKSEEVQDRISVSDVKKNDIKSFLSRGTDNAASFFDTSVITQTDPINERNLFPKSDNINSSPPKIEARDSSLIITQTDEIVMDKANIEDNNIPTIQTQSIPLFNVTKSSDDINVQKSIKNVSIDQRKDTVLDDQISPSKESNEIHTSKEDSLENELNMCETCREVNLSEEKPESLTAQLIDNITSRIQLSNPVEVPLTFNNTLADDRTDFDSNQCAEISHITEETIETIQVQSATELLENDDQANNSDARTYGWCADGTPLYPAPKVIQDHDYSFQPDPNAVGFFSKNSLFFDDIPNNASDEIKAEFKNSHEDSTTILPRQMSIPSAPPAEDFDDTKSDVTGGLDVQSIEQDAKKDFPIYEEFVIEPSGTDDDKIEFREREKSSDDSAQELDTFTNRVERFKKMEESTSDIVDDVFERRSSQLFDLPITTSPAITIASYFDTGNYAVETHYRNSLTSPSNMISFSIGSTNIPMRIPPGFEDEYNKKIGVASGEMSSEEKKEPSPSIPSIPDTSMQSYLSPTLILPNILNISVESSSTIKSTDKLQQPVTETVNLPDFATAFGRKELVSPKSTNISTTSDLSNFFDGKNEAVDITPTISENQEALMLKDTPEPEALSAQSLPDPMNFFSTNVESSEPRQEADIDSGVNRLASYFASPTKIDHSKSFFELSQSQDHYRQKTESTQSISAFKFNENENPSGDNKESNINEHKSFFETVHRESHSMVIKNTQNIPTNQYLANMALMRDLTDYQNSDFSNNEQIVRTVNYFTIEYDNDKINDNLFNVNNKNINKVTDLSIDNSIEKDNSGNSKIDNQLGETINVNDNNFESIVNCKYCCNTNAGILKSVDFENVTNFKVRRTMDRHNSEPRKEQDGDKEEKKDEINRRSVNFDNFSLNDESNEGVAMISESRSSTEYTPVKHHWFYRVDCEGKSVWRGFSMADSRVLEETYHSPDLNENTLVPTDGGRYDVNIIGRLRIAVYWTDKPTNVRRCSWFYKGTDGRYVPYTESVAEKLEEEYRHGMMTGEWHRRLMLPNNELVVMHGPAVMVHFLQTPSPDAFAPPAQSTQRPRVVRRGCDEYEVEDTEPSTIDHLLLLCHGVGSACDMRFRPVEEVVDDFRATSLQLIQSHYRNSYDNAAVGRVEVLPISWHSTLHSGEAGVDRRLAQITLDSIPRLRNFTNDTVLDVLFYTSPIFCQTIINTVCKELNRVYGLFKSRNPNFKGGVSLGGHSLGSVILFDLLCHQIHVLPSSPKEPLVSEKRYVSGTAGTGQPTVNYPRLEFSPDALYALGSPIAIFECIRGVESLGPDFRLPTCKNFFNIFHPYDPIAYRIEPLINPQLKNAKPYLIPHHKGRKRMHLELKDTMARVGADLKQKLIESIKSTWTSMWRSQPPPNEQLEKVVEEEIDKEQFEAEIREDNTQFGDEPTSEMLGQLNAGRRIDYVLQEAPFEMINEYLFAMTSHVGYWESEDTMLMILREIYDSLGVQPDNTIPQQSLKVQRTRAIRGQDDSTFADISDHPSTSRGDP